jgi:tetratricopeptide repeat protein 30
MKTSRLVRQALVGMEEDPNNGFHKLNFLLGHPPFPPETFGNLLLLHCKYGATRALALYSRMWSM